MVNPFALPRWIYWLVGLLAVALGVYFWRAQEMVEAEKAAALAGGPPPAARLEAFDAARHRGPFDEIVMLAQVDLGAVYQLSRGSPASGERRWIAPLYATDARRPADAPLAVLFETEGGVPEAKMRPWVEGVGPIGPILRLNGRLESPGSFGSMVADALGQAGLSKRVALLYVDPFLDGREAALAPNDDWKWSTGGLGALGVVALAYGFLRRRETETR